MVMSGVFERFPRLKFVMTEAGCAWVPPLLERLDDTIRGIRDTGATGEIRYSDEHVLPQGRHRVLPPELLDGREPAPRGRRRRPPPDRHRPVHVGQRLPARRGHVPVHPGAPAGPVRRRARGRDAQDPRRQRRQALRLRPRQAGAAGREDRADGRRGEHARSTRYPTRPWTGCPATWTRRRSSERRPTERVDGAIGAAARSTRPTRRTRSSSSTTRHPGCGASPSTGRRSATR